MWMNDQTSPIGTYRNYHMKWTSIAIVYGVIRVYYIHKIAIFREHDWPEAIGIPYF